MLGLQRLPHYDLPGGGIRMIGPTAQLAAMLDPKRFSWLLRVNPSDSEYASLIRQVRDSIGGRAIRIDPGMVPEDMRLLGEGGYDAIAAATAEAGLTLCVFAPDHPQYIQRLARKFPDLKIVLDHCGVMGNELRARLGGHVPQRDESAQLALFDEVLRLSDLPNVALKWCHASYMFGKPAWPGRDLWPILRRAIAAFGAERILWASDYTANQRGESWGEILYGIRADPGLTQEELALILGGTARKWFNWPA
jgi:L-fuconolactonase